MKVFGPRRIDLQPVLDHLDAVMDHHGYDMGLFARKAGGKLSNNRNEIAKRDRVYYDAVNTPMADGSRCCPKAISRALSLGCNSSVADGCRREESRRNGTMRYMARSMGHGEVLRKATPLRDPLTPEVVKRVMAEVGADPASFARLARGFVRGPEAVKGRRLVWSALRAGGWPVTQIGRATGACHTTVCSALRTLAGIPKGSKKRPAPALKNSRCDALCGGVVPGGSKKSKEAICGG